MTVKERRLLKHLPKSKSITEAAVKAGLGGGKNRQSAASSASRMLKNVNVRDRMLEAYKKAGLTEEHLAKRDKELIDAEDLIVTPVGPIPDPKKKGEFLKRPNWQARGKGSEIAHKVRGDYKESIEIPGLADAIEKLTDDQLNARIEALMSKVKKH